MVNIKRNYDADIASASDMLCEMLVKDLGSKQEAWNYANRLNSWDNVADWIIGTPSEDNDLASLWDSVAKAAKEHFENILLKTY